MQLWLDSNMTQYLFLHTHTLAHVRHMRLTKAQNNTFRQTDRQYLFDLLAGYFGIPFGIPIAILKLWLRRFEVATTLPIDHNDKCMYFVPGNHHSHNNKEEYNNTTSDKDFVCGKKIGRIGCVSRGCFDICSCLYCCCCYCSCSFSAAAAVCH